MLPRLTQPRKLRVKQSTKKLISPITGEMQLYQLTNFLTTVTADNTVDPVVARDRINEEFTSQGVDAICTEVRHIKSPVMMDTLLVDAYLPASSPIDPATISIIYTILKYVIPLIVLFGGLIAVTIVAKEAISELLYPKQFYGYDGSGPYTRAEAVTYNAAHNPDKFVDPITSLVFDTKEERDWYTRNTPSDWLPTPDIGEIVKWLAIGVAVVVGGYFLAKFLKE